MEMTLTILMALGIFVGIPVVIGLAISGVYVMMDRQGKKVTQVAREETKAYTKIF
jgi:hypothetical protein